MTTKRNLIISELSFILDGAHCADTFNDKTIRFRCLLEPLLAVPYNAEISETSVAEEP